MELNLELPDFLTRRADGEIVVDGTRVTLFHVMTAFANGLGAEDIADQFPTLSLASVYKTIGFALDHREKVDAYMAEYRAELDRQYENRKPQVTLDELRRRMKLLRAAQGAPGIVSSTG
jgi:uncharacterized protein (DUF433 family)